MSDSTTARIRLLSPADDSDILSAFTADAEMKRQGDVADLASAAKYREFLINHDEGNYGFAVEVDGRCAGLVGINGATLHRLGWFFYWMHPDYRGRGLTGRAAATVANWALRDGGFDRLELGHRANNPASGAIASAAGFIHEGIERQKFLIDGQRIDVFTYGRLSTDAIPETHPLPGPY